MYVTPDVDSYSVTAILSHKYGVLNPPVSVGRNLVNQCKITMLLTIETSQVKPEVVI